MKALLRHEAAPHLAFGLMQGAILLASTGGHINLYLVALVSLVAFPAITLSAARLYRHLELRHFEDEINRTYRDGQ
jgi:hypothetical protein